MRPKKVITLSNNHTKYPITKTLFELFFSTGWRFASISEPESNSKADPGDRAQGRRLRRQPTKRDRRNATDGRTRTGHSLITSFYLFNLTVNVEWTSRHTKQSTVILGTRTVFEVKFAILVHKLVIANKNDRSQDVHSNRVWL